jgi:hypothetical protein
VFLLRTKKWESGAAAAILTDDKQCAKFQALFAEEQKKMAGAQLSAASAVDSKVEVVTKKLKSSSLSEVCGLVCGGHLHGFCC